MTATYLHRSVLLLLVLVAAVSGPASADFDTRICSNFCEVGFNTDEIFAKQPKREPTKGIIPSVSRQKARRCDRQFRRFWRETGVRSKSLLACCLFGEKSGFCKPELHLALPNAPVLCNNDTQTAPRDPSHRRHPVGQCCVSVYRNKFRYECLEDQSGRECDCPGRDPRCDDRDTPCSTKISRNVYCGCRADYREPVFKRVSNLMQAGVRLITHKCFARPKARQCVAALKTCCGIDVIDTSYCETYCVWREGTCSRVPLANCFNGRIPG